MRVVGFSLIANAVRLDFPVVEALRSILPLCDELVVNVGPSEDDTRDLVLSLHDPRVRIIDGRWDPGQGGAVLAIETQRALEACRGDWAIYIQADEVLHEAGIDPLKAAMSAALDDTRVEGLLVEFLHFYGGTKWLGTGRAWYRREVRVVRPAADIRSHEEGQGFRVGPSLRKIRARRGGASYYHYGWARPTSALREKREADNALYYGGQPHRRPLADRLPWEVGLRRFGGGHPAVMSEWIAARQAGMAQAFAPRPWNLRRLALLSSLGLERLTGWRPFEFTNYIEV
jgi:glycosyltransferase involved in cell wall biosynthesis